LAYFFLSETQERVAEAEYPAPAGDGANIAAPATIYSRGRFPPHMMAAGDRRALGQPRMW